MSDLKTTGRITSSQAIFTGPGAYGGVEVITDGTNNATCTVYDGPTSGGGNEIFHGVVKGSSNFGGHVPPEVITVQNNGLYVYLSGTGAEAIVHYRAG